MNDPVLSRLGLARRANRLAVGTEAVKTALQKKKARLVVVAQDISAKTEKELRFLGGENAQVLRLPYALEDVAAAIGIRAGILAVLDDGFAQAICKAVNQSQSEG